MFHIRPIAGTALLTACALAVMPSAHAAVQAEASLSGIGYQLQALDPSASPLATFSADSANSGSASAETYVDFGATLQSSANDDLAVDGLLGTLSVQASQASSQAQVAISAGTVSGTVDLMASGNAAGGPTVAHLSNFYAVGAAPMGASFTLSAYTSITFFASVNLLAHTTIGLDTSTGQDEWGLASASFYTDGTGDTGTGYQISEFYKDLYAGYTLDGSTGEPVGESQSFSDQLSVTFYNRSSSAITGSFYAVVTANGQSAVSAVPEPATWALSIAGVALLVPAAARRRRRSIHAGAGPVASFAVA